MPNNKYRHDIQVLRGISVLAVIFFHFDSNFFPDGYLGVDVFFIISGFVVIPQIIKITEQSQIDLIKKQLFFFFKKRVLRLAPAFFFMLLVTLPLILILTSPGFHIQIALQALSAVAILGNLGAYKLSGDYFYSAINPYTHTWSLSVEEQFYFFIPILLIIIKLFIRKRKFNVKKYIVFFLGLSLCLWLFPELLNPFYRYLDLSAIEVVTFYSPLTRAWQFLAGAFAFFLVQNQRNVFLIFSKLRKTSFVLLFTILFSNVIQSRTAASISVSLITFFLLITHNIERPTRQNLISKIGDRSYSIYLFHLPILFIVFNSPINATEKIDLKVICYLLSVVILLILSEISFRRVENHFRFLHRMQKISWKKIFSSSMVCLFLVFAVSIVMILGSPRLYWGFETRNIDSKAAWNIDDNCKIMSQDLALDLCRYGNFQGRPTVWLLGDSHAAMYSNLLMQSAKKLKWNLVISTSGACNFVLLVDKRSNSICVQRNLKTLEIVNKEKPELIILSQYYHADSTISSLVDGIMNLEKSTQKLVLIRNNPAWSDVNQFGIRLPLIIRNYMPAKKGNILDFEDEDKKFSDNISRLVSKRNLISIDPFDFLCQDKLCIRYEDGQWLYWDSHHLSIIGAEKLRKPIEELLRG